MPTARTDPELVAPRWHTSILIAVILAVAATGAAMTHGAPASASPQSVSRITTSYLPMIVVQCGLALYVCRIARPRSVLVPLLGERWTSVRRATFDLAIGFAGWLLIQAFELAWARLVGAGAAPSVLGLLPTTLPERLVWVAVAASAGFCEEIVYRGYLQTQLTAFTGRANLVTLLQAALFGIAHGEQGLRAVARVALYGLAFGALARWRRSLLPGVLCHIATDLASGLLR